MPTSPAPRSRPVSDPPAHAGEPWLPTASPATLRRRAAILTAIRRFFAARGVLEVETPLLAAGAVTDPHLASLRSRVETLAGGRDFYLQTSPEFHMKRLLAAGSGPIYQLGKAFRDGEAGRLHNPEFTLLEWYRPGFDHHALMDEMDALLAAVLGVPAAERLTYGDLFRRHLDLDPHRASPGQLARAAAARGIAVAGLSEDERDPWLHLLLSHAIEPHLGHQRPTFVYDFPASQAALARLRPGEPPVAERFEVYAGGLELANGFHELTDADEQRQRFAAEQETRRQQGLAAVPMDEHLLAALAAGLPPCAGVALGVDRLVMLATASARIEDVVAFPIDRA